MGHSIEKAKLIIEQFKSLTKANEISVRSIDVFDIIEAASQVVRETGVSVRISRKNDKLQVLADPMRITECFDELFANSLHWLDKSEKKIDVTIYALNKKETPSELDSTKTYVRIVFEDNGCGSLPR